MIWDNYGITMGQLWDNYGTTLNGWWTDESVLS